MIISKSKLRKLIRESLIRQLILEAEERFEDHITGSEEGNTFRQYVNNVHPNVANRPKEGSRDKLDPEGKHDNSYMRAAWDRVGDDWVAAGKGTEAAPEEEPDDRSPGLILVHNGYDEGWREGEELILSQEFKDLLNLLMVGVAVETGNASLRILTGMDERPVRDAADNITEMIVDKIRVLKPSRGDPPRQKLIGWARCVGMWNGFNWTFKSNTDIQGIIGSPTPDDPNDRWTGLLDRSSVTRRLGKFQDMTFCQFGNELDDMDDDFMGLGNVIGNNSTHEMASELWYGNKAQGNRIQKEVYEGYDGDYGAAMVPEAGSQYGKIDNDSFLMVAPEGRTADGSENTYSTVQLPNEESAEEEA